jgi:hypothetical protein
LIISSAGVEMAEDQDRQRGEDDGRERVATAELLGDDPQT